MRIGVFGLIDQPVIAAFVQGCEALGHSPVLRNPAGLNGQPEQGFDCVCVYGLHGNNQKIIDLYAAQGVPAVVLDFGYTHRPDYWQAGWQGLCSIPAGPCCNDRALALYGPAIPASARSSGGYVLVCCQKHGDKQHGLPSVRRWAESTITAIQKLTDTPIRFRPHPLYRFVPGFGVEISDPEKESLEEALAGACCMVTYNSTAALQALLSGVPVFCDSSAMYAGFCNTDLAKIGAPEFLPAAGFFDRLAYGQWNLGEIARGEALEFLLQRKNEALHAAVR